MRLIVLLTVALVAVTGCLQGDPAGTPSPSPTDPTDPSPTPSPTTTSPGDFIAPRIIFGDTTWSGTVHVTDYTVVAPGTTLTIEPGTKVLFRHERDYRADRKPGMEVRGTLHAVGTPEARIMFTSDAPEPQNGDWHMLRLFGKTGSEVRYAIVEYAQQGINLWDSDARISHSIVRWNNWEGIYAESYATPTIEYNRIYQNGYNGMAMEQFNDATVRFNLFEESGTHGIHIDASDAIVEGNIFRKNGAAGLSLDNAATAAATSNSFLENRIAAIMCGEGENRLTASGNDLGAGEFHCPPDMVVSNTAGAGAGEIAFGYDDIRERELGYIPGDQEKDRFLYVYPDDETRRIGRKLGEGLGLTWSITVEGDDVWTSVLDGRIYKLDGQTGAILRELQAPSPQPWGMAWDGSRLWITDFAEKRTYALDPNSGAEVASFQNPDQVRGAKGLAWDGTHLHVMGWTTGKVHVMTTGGALVRTVSLPGSDGGLTWTGTEYWAPCGKHICRFSASGSTLGKIYAASEGTWDLAWEPAEVDAGGYLWATQRTNENWLDAKLFRLEILDDQVALRS